MDWIALQEKPFIISRVENCEPFRRAGTLINLSRDIRPDKNRGS